jgi:hypothetical protein
MLSRIVVYGVELTAVRVEQLEDFAVLVSARHEFGRLPTAAQRGRRRRCYQMDREPLAGPLVREWRAAATPFRTRRSVSGTTGVE